MREKVCMYQFGRIITALGIALFLPVIAHANELGIEPWQLGFQEPASEIMAEIDKFHNFLLYIIIAISVFVLALLIYTCYRFSEKNNPVPSKRSHNTFIEIIWTVIPVIILVAIAIPSFRLLFFQERLPETEITLKVIGYQWYWGYEYPEYNLAFDSNMKQDDLGEGDHRLLSVDNPVVLPINTKIRLQTTAADVIHSWAVPAFGVKLDAIPGRLNEGWFEITKPGTYYGQCSELCGVLHGFMPVEIKAVTKEEFKEWTQAVQEEFGDGTAPQTVEAVATQAVTNASAIEGESQ